VGAGSFWPTNGVGTIGYPWSHIAAWLSCLEFEKTLKIEEVK